MPVTFMESDAISKAVAFAAGSTAPRMLAHRALHSPEQLAVRELDAGGVVRSWNWSDLHEAVANWAAALQSHGVLPGDRVGILCEPGVRGLVAFIGAHATGCIATALQTSQGPDVWRRILLEVQPSVFVADRAMRADFLPAEFLPGLRLVVDAGEVPGAAEPQSAACCAVQRGWQALVEEGAAFRRTTPAACEERMKVLEPDAPCVVYYTSGSTGEPKGVLASWKGLVLSWCSFFTKGYVEPPPAAGDRSLHDIQLAVTSGFWLGIACPLVFGCTAYVPAPAMDGGAARKMTQPTVFYGRPPFWVEAALRIQAKITAQPRVWQSAHRLLMHQGEPSPGGRTPGGMAAIRRRCSSFLLRPFLHDEGLALVRHAFCAGTPLSASVTEQWAAWGITIRTFYGMTECSGLATVMTGDAPRPGTVGRPTPCADIRLADDGEILIGGPILFKGYLTMPEATAKAIDADGYYHTGDLGRFDTLGNLVILDRKSSLIELSTGEKVLPSQIELLLARSPCVASCSLVGEKRSSAGILVEIRPDEVRRRLPAELAASLCTYEQLAADPRVRALIQAEVDVLNAALAAEGKTQVTAFRLLPRQLDPQDGEIRTATGKVRRGNLHKRYARLIEEMYEPSAAMRQPQVEVE